MPATKATTRSAMCYGAPGDRRLRKKQRPKPKSNEKIGFMWKLSLFVALAAVPGLAQPNNYGDAKPWLCRPGQHDACDVDLTTTVIAPGRKLSRDSRFSASAPASTSPSGGGRTL